MLIRFYSADACDSPNRYYSKIPLVCLLFLPLDKSSQMQFAKFSEPLPPWMNLKETCEYLWRGELFKYDGSAIAYSRRANSLKSLRAQVRARILSCQNTTLVFILREYHFENGTNRNARRLTYSWTVLHEFRMVAIQKPGNKSRLSPNTMAVSSQAC